MDENKPYGYELILDLHGCDVSRFNRRHLRRYFKALCQAIGMTRCKLEFWDDKWVLPWRRQTSPHTKGSSAVQFILTSNVTVHCLDILEAVYVNIFSCKDFDPKIAEILTKTWFGAETCSARFIERI